ncbi:cobalt/nickel transport system permease protein [Halogranum amylolyticum]|uniref:Cobalt/nickel transport system permease protein n=1 Tax=Halogranum amylolyticum TaxID=660520 RepID=A0A1H8W301_9EURY|nr:cobalt ECF transporter T component CbiQ [Halogranum amylolyticum]SEP21903.1 cobalt/nickel transport system permease protein [Halogranum amylolyticum]
MTYRGVLDRTVAELGAHVRLLLLGESYPARDGFLQRVDPTLKLLGVTAVVVAAVATHEVGTLLALLVAAFGLGRLSAVPLRTLFARVWLPPTLSAVVVAPRVVLTPGTPLVALGPLSPTDAGVAYVATFVVRVAACVALLSLVLLTTHFTDLLAALRRLRVPTLFVGIVAVTYRYLLVFLRELQRLVVARRARTIRGRRPSLRESWRESGSLLGTFFVRTLERSERVQAAAAARGGGRRAIDVGGRHRTTSSRRSNVAFAALVLVGIVGVVVA